MGASYLGANKIGPSDPIFLKMGIILRCRISFCFPLKEKISCGMHTPDPFSPIQQIPMIPDTAHKFSTLTLHPCVLDPIPHSSTGTGTRFHLTPLKGMVPTGKQTSSKPAEGSPSSIHLLFSCWISIQLQYQVSIWLF